MRFYFTSQDANLTKAGAQGGCGVTAAEVLLVTHWQNVLSYQFEFHLENHGDYVYIFPDGRKAGAKNMPRFYFAGGKQGTFDNAEDLKSKVMTDVRNVVTNNYALFAAMHQRFYA